MKMLVLSYRESIIFKRVIPKNKRGNVSMPPQPNEDISPSYQPQPQDTPVVSTFSPQSAGSSYEATPGQVSDNKPYVTPPQPANPVSYNSTELVNNVEAVDQASVVPTPVVQVLSPRGVEYVMLTIALFTSAIGLVSILLCLVNGQTSLVSLSLPVSLMLVGLPIFAGLFLRLKKAELNNPSLKLDQSKRRSTQTTQIVAFIVSLFTLVGLFVSIFAAISGTMDNLGKTIASTLIVFIVFGGILAYYWWDEHRN